MGREENVLTSERDRITHTAAAYGLAILTLLNFLNYIDRYILSAVLPRIKTEFAVSDFDLGILANAFLIAYFVTSPLFGRRGDRGRRTRWMAAGVAVWSLATGLAGLARSFRELLAFRSGVGVGEAAYGTIAPALLADYFPEARRGRAFAIFYVAIPVGSAVGFLLGGALEQAFGWRTAFLAVGAPGLLLALLALTAPDPPRGTQEAAQSRSATTLDSPPESIASVLATLWRNRTYVGTVAGYTAYTFALGGLAVWMPTYLNRVRGLTLARADTFVGAATVLAGLGGTFAGGWLADWLAARVRHGHLWLSGVATLLAAAPAWAALSAASPSIYLSSFVIAEALLFLSTSPINVVLVGVVPVAMRATAMAVSIFVMHALGDAISPPIIGALADRHGLGSAVLVVPVAVATGGVIWTLTASRAR
jgi:MFS family permease